MKQAEPPAHSIAVVGMAGRFPGASDIDQFWCDLKAGKEGIRRFSTEELRRAGLPETVISAPDYVKARGIIDGVEYFDAGFFGLSPRQARILDPQQRVWLECVQEALEDAGCPAPACSVSVVGIFAGARESTYLLNNLCTDRESQERLLTLATPDAYQVFISNDKDSIATRTSYLFNFTGPSVNVQSACSTSLVAVAQACWSLADHQCDVAVAGGVCVTFPTIRGYHFQEGSIYSPDGHCRAFDARARGTVFGDGVGAVVLKRLDSALRDGSRIDAVIRGWAINNDGSDKSSFTAPSVRAQAEVVALAQAMGDVEPGQIGYVETHGTGTPVGDPIEVAGLTRAFSGCAPARRFCGLGSVKTNVGHLDTAAGIAGFIKTVLMVRHGELPPSLHFETPNPEIDFANSPFYVVDRLTEWPANGAPRVAGVSAFGVGGTNCHVVLEEAPVPVGVNGGSRRAVVLTLSAKTPRAVTDLQSRYRQFLTHHTDLCLTDAAFTTNTGRLHHAWRLAAVGESVDEVRDDLAHRTPIKGVPQISPDTAQIGFLFTGQGAQHAHMARQLYETQPVFRAALDHCDAVLRPELDTPLLEVLYPGGATHTLLDRTDYAQPALFAVEYALAEMWRSWNVVPTWVMGHSVGEYVAACCAGVFSVEDGLRLVADRGRLMNPLQRGGRMVAVFAAQDRVADAVAPFSDRVAVAAQNSPRCVVISGAGDAVHTIVEQFKRQGVLSRELRVSHAFHSPLMDPVLAPLERRVSATHLQRPALDLVSNLTGELAGDAVTTPEYWRDHTRHPVRFAAGVLTMRNLGCRVFIEIGPHAVLTQFGRETLDTEEVSWLPSLRRGESDWRTLASAVSELYAQGADIDWTAFNGPGHRMIRLPTYPFQRERFWVEGESDLSRRPAKRGDGSANPMLGLRMCLAGSDEIRFDTRYRAESPGYLSDHRLFDRLVVPGASHLAMLLQAAQDAFGPSACRFEDVVFVRPLVLSERGARRVQLVFSPDAEARRRRVELMSAAAETDGFSTDAWSVHVTGSINAPAEIPVSNRTGTVDIDAFRDRSGRTLSGDEFYRHIWGNSAGTGKAFQWIESVWKRDGEALAKTRCPQAADDGHRYRLHPGLVEAGFQVLHCCATFETVDTVTKNGVIFVPFSLDEFSCYTAAAGVADIWCHAALRDLDPDNVVADVRICDQSGRVMVEMVGLRLRKLSRAAVTRPTSKDHRTTPPVAARSAARVITAESHTTVAERLASAAKNQRPALLRAYLQQKLADISGYPPTRFPAHARLLETGFDSLMAVMLANRIKSDLNLSLPLALLLTDLTVQELAQEVGRRWPDKHAR